ncbi:MAG: M1 family metallopeptidase [Bacteroidota bacterium]
MNKLLFSILLTASLSPLLAQQTFTRQDTLRGSITPERAWWDLTYYHLDIEVDPKERRIEGQNLVQYRVLEAPTRMQIDLQNPMEATAFSQAGKELAFEREGNVYWVEVPTDLKIGKVYELNVTYGGRPVVAARPPWDGGLTWSKHKGKPFIATSCQGDGASLWWPCKDHMYDEVDSMLISVRVPEGLTNVSNGRFRGTDAHPDGSQTFHWFVANPINNYGVNINIGDYVDWSEVYEGEKGGLDCSYYVLRSNEEKARKQFQQVPLMLEAFEHWFGPYPFYEDGFKLVEVPYLGMEHQSSVTYGNRYSNGYLGNDLSGSGWGLKFDFIIIHESGHEWFANNITYKDIADMWVHEGFTAYSENLYVDYHFGKKAAAEYVLGTRSAVQNDRPIIGFYDVNKSGSGDMYYKGANLLHTLRQIVNDDEQWRSMLRGMNETFYHQTVTTQQIESYLSEQVGLDLTSFFDQYLRDTRIPVLEYRLQSGFMSYRWGNAVRGFDMPVEVMLNGEVHRLEPRTTWKSLRGPEPGTEVVINPNYYVGSMNLTGK